MQYIATRRATARTGRFREIEADQRGADWMKKSVPGNQKRSGSVARARGVRPGGDGDGGERVAGGRWSWRLQKWW